ncbi:Shedu anti-phage system protein SduA domain-containing protein [Mesorhizobium sp. M0018]|uniref:Shedu anti-phage system protein SduA domain-containing protein n=1 Tax=Mesorhizobium sp. M0018 TaxID=2956844 RepID=UPI00333D145F
MAVLEIKTPGTALLSRQEYRGGVFGPSSELVSAITQVLDQVNKLQRHLPPQGRQSSAWVGVSRNKSRSGRRNDPRCRAQAFL